MQLSELIPETCTCNSVITLWIYTCRMQHCKTNSPSSLWRFQKALYNSFDIQILCFWRIGTFNIKAMQILYLSWFLMVAILLMSNWRKCCINLMHMCWCEPGWNSNLLESYFEILDENCNSDFIFFWFRMHLSRSDCTKTEYFNF